MRKETTVNMDIKKICSMINEIDKSIESLCKMFESDMVFPLDYAETILNARNLLFNLGSDFKMVMYKYHEGKDDNNNA